MPHYPTLPHTADVLLFALADLSQDARTLNLARALAHHGMRVSVVATAPKSFEESTINIIRWTDPGGSAFRRWSSFNTFCTTLDVTPRVVCAMDLFGLRSATAIARKHSVHTLYDMREFYFALGPLKGRGAKQRLIAYHEQRLMKHVRTVIVSGRMDAAIVQKKFALPERPFVLLNTPPYKERVASTFLRSTCNISLHNRVAIYQGVVHEGRGLRPFLRAMTEMPDVHLCIVGDGPARRSIGAFAHECRVENRVHWLGSVPYDELHAITCSADFGICLIEPVSLSYEYALPNKLFEYMTARIPCIATDLPALQDQILRTPVGVLVGRALNLSDVVSAVRLLRNETTYRGMVEACEAIRDLSYERQVLAAADLFREQLS